MFVNCLKLVAITISKGSPVIAITSLENKIIKVTPENYVVDNVL